MNLEIAIREKYRFNFKGSLSVEDLFDLSRKDLSDIHGALSKESKSKDEGSLIQTRTSNADKTLENKIAIVKHVFDTKESEREATANKAANKLERDRLLAIKALRDEKAELDLSDEELDAKIAAVS